MMAFCVANMCSTRQQQPKKKMWTVVFSVSLREENFGNFLSARGFVRNYQYIHINKYMVNSCNFKFTKIVFIYQKEIQANA